MGILFRVIDIELDKEFMKMALQEAKEAGQNGEVPIGAILVKGGEVVAKDHNRCIGLNDPTAHAEVLVLRKGGKILKNYRLSDTTLYVTAEPCPMCAAAMIHGRISRLVYGSVEPKFGAVESRLRLLDGNGLNHQVKIERGVLEKECAEILKYFFKEKRNLGHRGEVKNQSSKLKDKRYFAGSEFLERLPSG